MFKKILEKGIVFLVLIGMLVTAIPISTKAGVNQERANNDKEFILYLVGSEDSEYRSGQNLSDTMNAKQIEDGLWELLDTEVEPIISDLEEAVTYANNQPDEDYNEAVEMLYGMRQIRAAVKGCYEIISENRSDIKYIYDLIENPEDLDEHEIEFWSVKLLEKADELEEEIYKAVAGYSNWVQQLSDAQERLLDATPNTSLESSKNDSLQEQLVSLKTGRAAQLKELANQEKSSTKEKDVVLDVISINEIRIYAWDENKKPLTNATIYCWKADPAKTDEDKGAPLKPNDEGYVTIPISKLGADEDYFMTVGFEVSCPGYRTQYAHAEYIKGAEGIICKLEKNNPNEDIYIAGISLNGNDIQWYEKNMYITQENNADQAVTLHLRSQSGKDFSGKAKMTYKKTNDKEITLEANYEKTKNGEAKATFSAKLCQEIDPNQKDAITFNLSTSNSNAEKKPKLKFKKARIEKTGFKGDQTLMNNIGLGDINISGPSNIPVLQALSLNIDFKKVFGHQPLHVYTNCSGLWAVVFSTDDIDASGLVKLMPLKTNPLAWQTKDTRELEEQAKKALEKTESQAKRDAENNIKKAKHNAGKGAYFGTTKIIFRIMGGYMGNIGDSDTKGAFFASIAAGFRGDWKIYPPTPIPLVVSLGFELSMSTFFKFHITQHGYGGFNFNIYPKLYGYASLGVGLKLVFEGGVRVAATLVWTIPVIHHTDDDENHKMFNASIGLSVYMSIFFINFNFNIVSGEGYKDFTTGKGAWKTIPFWKAKNDNSDNDQQTDYSEGYSSNEKPDEKIIIEDKISGDTKWTYNGYTYSKQTDAVPIYFNLHWEGKAASTYTSDTNYICWVEDGKAVKYRTANHGEGSDIEFEMPQEVQTHLNSGEWKITGVRAAVNPQVYSFTDHAAGRDVTEEFQVATMTVTVGTDWQTITEMVDGKEITRSAPMGSVIVTRMFLSTGNGIMKQLEYVERREIRKWNPKRHPVIYIEKVNAPVTDAIGMAYDVQLRNITREQWAANFDIVMTNNTNRTIVTTGTIPKYYNGNATSSDADMNWDDEEEIASNEELLPELEEPINEDARPTSGPGIVYLKDGTVSENIVERGYTYANMPNGTPVKQLIGDAGTRSFILILMDDGRLYALSAARASVTEIANNIGNIEMLRVDRKKNDKSQQVVFTTPKDSGSKTPLQSIILDCEYRSTRREVIFKGQVTDYDIDLKGSAFFVGHLLNENYLYWFDDYEDENKNHMTAIRGMCYSPKHNMLMSPSRLGVLTGTDGNTPQGFVTTSSPVYSQALSDGNMIITKAWIPDADQGESQPKKILSTYKINTSRCVNVELMGAGPKDRPFVSAGRDNDLAFSFINKGNIPVVGFDLNIYSVDENGQKKLMQTNHINILDPTQNKVTYHNEKKSNDGDELFEGKYATRRIDGLYDTINKDAWNILRFNKLDNDSANGNILVKVPALMPEGSQTYASIFRVPIDWKGKRTIRCEMDKIFVPEHVADIFDSGTKNGVQANIDPSDVKVLAISAANSDNANLLNEGEGVPANVCYAGTLDNFSDPGDDAENINGANYTFTPSLYEVECEDINLAINCRVFESDDEEYATITVRQEGQTEAAPQGLKIQSWLDGQEYPSFEYTFATHPTGGQEAYSITLPLSRLTNNQNGDTLKITVSDTVASNIESSSIDNYTIIELNTGLRIVSQPQDVSVKQGQNATLSVEAAGGQEPYKYTWQKFENNKWVNVQSGSNPELVVRMVTKEMNGKLFRCVVEDSADGRVESDTVKLTVTGQDPYKPVTGDSNNIMAWIILLLLALIVGASMIIIDKRRRI